MRVRDVHINGIGVFVPPLQSADVPVRQGLLTAATVERMGFTSAAVAGDLPAPEMGLRAARDAVKQSGVSPGEFALLLYADVWHQGPVSWQPQLYLQHHLVGDATLSVEIRQGCIGMMSGIELAVGMLRADPTHRAALVVGSDNFGTPLMDRWTSGAGFTVLGDGAAAVVLTEEPGLAEVLSMCTVAHTALEERWRGGEPLFPPGVTLGRPVDFLGGQRAFGSDPESAADLAMIAISHVQRMTECTQRALDEAGVRAADIVRVVPNNMPREEGRAYLGMLGFTPEQSTWEFGRALGHLGASDQVVALHHLLTTGQVGPGDHVLLCGLAPGITYKAGVVRITALP